MDMIVSMNVMGISLMGIVSIFVEIECWYRWMMVVIVCRSRWWHV